MKKKLTLIIITVFLALLFAGALCACNKNEIRNLKAIYETVRLPLNGSLYIENYITYEGKGKLNYAIENIDVLELKKNKVTGISAGKGKIVVFTDTETIAITVIVVNENEISVEAKDASFAYDGNIKNIKLEAPTMPQGSVISYFCEGNEFYGAKEPGTYEVEVRISVPQGYEIYYISQSATLFIDKAIVNMGGIKFPSAAYEYDGNEKSVSLNGILPDNVTVTYENNRATDAGTYKALAFFTVDTKYYYEIPPFEARLTINKKKFDYASYGFDNKTVCYNGQYQQIAFSNLPIGISADYYLGQNKITDIATEFKNAGIYEIKAVINANEYYSKNYYFDSEVVRVLTITKANFSNSLEWIKPLPPQGQTSYVYNGEALRVGEGADIFLSGDLPAGINGEFSQGTTWNYYIKKAAGQDEKLDEENNSFINAGNYAIVVKFQMPEGYDVNYEKLSEMEFSLVIKKAKYPVGNVSFEGGEFIFDGNIRTYTVSRQPSFDDDVIIKYALSENGLPFTSFNETPISLKDAGEYQIKISFTYKTENLLKNYEPIAGKTISVKVKKMAVNLSGIGLPNAYFDYDKNPHSLSISGNLPENITVLYSENNNQINAGTYNITATFSYRINGEIVNPRNYYFIREEQETQNTLSAVMTINKIYYTAEEIPSYDILSGIYSPDKKLADYVITENGGTPSAYTRWANVSIIPEVNIDEYLAYYNKDKINYYDYSVIVSIDIEKAIIDGSALSIKPQFLAYTGQALKPIYTLAGYSDASKVLKALCDKQLVEMGEYHTNISFEIADGINYELINPPTPQNVYIHIYNMQLFEYDGTQLVKYYGAFGICQILNGTTSIKYGAISNNQSISEILLPSTLVKSGISNNAIDISTLPMLEKISMPFIGSSSASHLGGIFGKQNAELPSSLREIIVTEETEINADAFKNSKYLTKISYLKDVAEIGANAFYGCNLLTAVNFGSAVSSIGKYAFRYCFNLQSLSLPFLGSDAGDVSNTVEYLFGPNIEGNSYADYYLVEFSLSGNISSLPDFAFAGMKNLTKITLPESISSIGAEAFSEVKATVNLNTNMTSITNKMFYNYKGTALSLPSSITSIGEYAFNNAVNLTSISIPSGVFSIGQYAFMNVKCQVNFAQGSVITSIGDYAFCEYKGTSINIPLSVNNLGNYAFHKSGLTLIIVPQSISAMGTRIFSECPNLARITVEGALIGTGMFEKCPSLKEIVTTDTLTTISDYAFYECAALESALIRKNVNSIGSNAFGNCLAMNSCEILSMSEIPIYLGPNAFIAGLTIRVNKFTQYEEKYPNQYQFIPNY